MGLFDFGMINSFLHPEKGYQAAQKPVNQGWKEAQRYQQPYWQNGLDQTGKLTGAEDRLMNPGALENEWAQGYETSPYAKQMLEQNKNSGLDAASSMGLMGSSAALGNIQQGAGNIVNQDRQQYMQDLMQKYMTGIGLGQNIYGYGAGAGQNLGQGAMQHGETAGGLRYGEQTAPGELYGKLLGTGINTFAPGAGSGFMH